MGYPSARTSSERLALQTCSVQEDTPDGSWKGVLKGKRLGSDNLRERLDALPELLILQDVSTAERNFCKARDENDERLFCQHIVTALTQHPRKKPLVLPELLL
jgi:hypothetical protein